MDRVYDELTTDEINRVVLKGETLTGDIDVDDSMLYDAIQRYYNRRNE